VPTLDRRLTHEDVQRAEALWGDYQKAHDLSGEAGRTAGIDPESGRIWLGDSMLEVTQKQDAAGDPAPLFFVRIGSAYYFRKGALG
jgi:hypothetical protein